jgi:SAM-dependent methyltransferase
LELAKGKLMPEHDWNAHYAAGELPWDSAEPENSLVELVLQRPVAPGHALEVGCGTGTNALWLATQGFAVLAVDIAPLAIERAQKKTASANTLAQGSIKFEQRDFLNGPELPAGSFQLVFDRGCFHVFDEAKDQQKFAERVANALAPGGIWLSLLGSTEGPAREMGPPRRSARDIVNAIEPSLELVSLRSTEFTALPFDQAPRAWYVLSRKRDTPAQASTRMADMAAAASRKR